jgi:hypothetical protein
MKPKVGERRYYEGDVKVLYPGERAIACIDVQKAIEFGGSYPYPIKGWRVEPIPGIVGWLLRWRYRLWGRFSG